MNLERMQTLLRQVQQEKQAINIPFLGRYDVPWLNSGETVHDEPLKQLSNQAVSQKLKQILLTGVGAGAAIRGFHGVTNLLQDTQPSVPPPAINLPVVLPKDKKKPEKQAFDEQKPSENITDLVMKTPGALPAVLLGGPLSVYGGWKGMDMVLDRFRKKSKQDRLEDAKTQYEQALLGSYKIAVDQNLNQLYTVIKQADEDAFKRTIKSLYNMTPTSLKNIYGAYALAAMPLGYGMMNAHMQRTSPRAVLQEALQERARQRAITQPAQIYAYRANDDDEKNQP